MNKDAYADVLVGAPARNTNTGAASIYLATGNGSGLTSGASQACPRRLAAPGL